MTIPGVGNFTQGQVEMALQDLKARGLPDTTVNRIEALARLYPRS
jgi:hypothetical protein